MTTALDIVNAARRKLNIDALGDSVSNIETADSLKQLNRMLDSWNNDRLMIFATNSGLYPLAANAYVYTIGLSDRVITGNPLNVFSFGGSSVTAVVNGKSFTQPILIQDFGSGIVDPNTLLGNNVVGIDLNYSPPHYKIGDGVTIWGNLPANGNKYSARNISMTLLANTIKLQCNSVLSNCTYDGVNDILTFVNNGAGVLNITVSVSTPYDALIKNYSLTPLDPTHIEATRPVKITAAFTRTSNPNPIDYPLEVINNVQYQALVFKTINITYPYYLYYNPTVPFGTITLYPVPNIGLILGLSQVMQFIDLSNLTAQIQLPPGYEDAIIYNLAIQIAPDYGRSDKAVRGSQLWDEAKSKLAVLKRTNQERLLMAADPAIFMGRQGGVWNPYTDSYTGNIYG
jgi:hypothetical protein